MKYNISLLFLVGGVLSFLTAPALCVEPLSEEDMGDVSFESGLNFLNIYGPTAAGLSDDSVELDTEITTTEVEGDPEDNTAALSSAKIIEDNEKTVPESQTPDTAAALTFEEIEKAISSGERTIGQAEAFEVTSEIQYSKEAFTRGAEFLQNGDVIQTRDLRIDQLKLENLRGDDTSTSYGNIFLSDWESRGSTRLSVDN